MKTIIIGSGNVSTVISYNFYISGLKIYQVFSRNPDHCTIRNSWLQNGITNDWQRLSTTADVYLIAVSDGAIPHVARELYKLDLNPNAVVAHTAGNIDQNKLSDFNYHGVFYPLQTIHKERLISLQNVPILIEGNSSYSSDRLLLLGKRLSQKSQFYSGNQRKRLHLPAVMVNNFVNHLYSIAHDYCEHEGLSFELLHPLISETSKRIIANYHPMATQTGPAVRNDRKTLLRHQEALNSYPEYQKIYKLLSDSILSMYNNMKDENS